jgi:hypothetical protein
MSAAEHVLFMQNTSTDGTTHLPTMLLHDPAHGLYEDNNDNSVLPPLHFRKLNGHITRSWRDHPIEEDRGHDKYTSFGEKDADVYLPKSLRI